MTVNNRCWVKTITPTPATWLPQTASSPGLGVCFAQGLREATSHAASHSNILIVRVCQAIVSKLARLAYVSSRLVLRAVELLHALAIPGARIIDQRSPTRGRAAPELVESCLQLCATRPAHHALASSCTCQMSGPDLRFTVGAGGVAILINIRHTDWVRYC
jgi:hypothetical protein